MKKLILIGLTLFLMAATVRSQITLDALYNHSGTFTKLSQSGYKFFIMDVSANQCRIYHTNHILWKSISLSVPANHYLYDIKYVSENLFTNDNDLAFAYVYYSYDEVNQYYTYTTRIVKENGTLLLNIPGCSFIQVVEDQGLGTKMLAFVYDFSVVPYTIQTLVYNLPGSLVSVEEFRNKSRLFQNHVFPNPASAYINITYEAFGENELPVLQLIDSNGRMVKTIQLDPRAGKLNLPLAGFAPGLYTWSVSSDNAVKGTGKFIVQ
jgi:hypothetical protein